MKTTQPMNLSQDIQIPFIQTDEGLIAQNEHVRIVLSPVQNNVIYDDGSLIETTECNCLVRSLDDTSIALYINDQPADTLGFIQDNQALWGRITTGDRPGSIHFRVCTENSDTLYASLDVRPSRLDYQTDYQIMRTDLERICRELVYLLPNQARITTDLSDRKGSDLDFHQILDRLFNRLFRTLQAILKRPDRRLATIQLTRTIDQSPGRDPNALTELTHNPEFWTPTSGKNPPSHLPITDKVGCTHLRETHRHPDLNTPLNRHLKHQLNRLSRRAQTVKQTDLGHHVYKRLNHYLRRFALPLPKQGETLPVHIDIRYQTAFTLIRDLNRLLSPCTQGPFDLSYRDTPTLYEYWTWFTLIHTLCSLGFTPIHNSELFHLTNRGLSISPAQGEASSIDLQKGDCSIRCLYNPTYTTASGRALTHDLRPDIVMAFQHPNNKRTIHAFDAKYRRENHNNIWIPLREDIDKMHAYRDAIGQVTANDFERILKSAIVLFPAPSNPIYHTHPFYTSLPHGIGGLPLLPGDTHTLTALTQYLSEHILP